MHLLFPCTVEGIGKFDMDYSYYVHSCNEVLLTLDSHKFVDIGPNWYFVREMWMMMVRDKEQCCDITALLFSDQE